MSDFVNSETGGGVDVINLKCTISRNGKCTIFSRTRLLLLYCSMGVYQCVCTLPYDSKLEEQQVYSAAASLLLVGCLLLLPAAGGDDEGAAAAVLAS